jgi:hypothetical protein
LAIRFDSGIVFSSPAIENYALSTASAKIS